MRAAEAHVPMSTEGVTSSPVEVVARQKKGGKRSSPQRASDEENADLLKPAVEAKEPNVTTEQQGERSDGSPVKKQRLEGPSN